MLALLFFLLSCAKETASKSQCSDSHLCMHTFIWFVPVSSMHVYAHVPMWHTCGFQCSRKPLALLVKSPFFTHSHYRHETHIHTYTHTHTQVYSAFTWRPLEHCVDRLCAMLG